MPNGGDPPVRLRELVQCRPLNVSSVMKRQYAGRDDCAEKSRVAGFCRSRGRISTVGSIETRAATPPRTESNAVDPKPGSTHGVNKATTMHPIATRQAPRAVVPPPERIERRSCHTLTGPHAPTRRSASANRTASPALRKTNTYMGRAPSSITMPANTMSAAGGAMASSGLRARTARAWAANAAVQAAVTPATRSGGRGGAGATSTLDVLATEPNAARARCRVCRVGSPATVVSGKTSSEPASTRPAALASVASIRLRRSSAAARASATSATIDSRSVAPCP